MPGGGSRGRKATGPPAPRGPVPGSRVSAAGLARLGPGFDARAAGVNLTVGAPLQVRVNVLDLVHLQPEAAPRRHSLFGSSGAHGLDEQLLGRDRAAVLQGDDER